MDRDRARRVSMPMLSEKEVTNRLCNLQDMKTKIREAIARAQLLGFVRLEASLKNELGRLEDEYNRWSKKGDN